MSWKSGNRFLVIASGAKQSRLGVTEAAGLLRRYAPHNDEDYCSSGSRMNERFGPGGVTGLPCASNPVFSAVSSEEPGTGLPSGDLSCAVGAGAAAGPGGSS